MLALLVFSYACCGIGVWFGWYLRGRRDDRMSAVLVERAQKWRRLSESLGTVRLLDEWTTVSYASPFNDEPRTARIRVTAQDSTE